MNMLRQSVVPWVVGFALASCGEPQMARRVAVHPKPLRAGEFDQIGTVTLYPGESCASQVVFVFHTENSGSISLAAPWHQSQVLKDAVRTHRKVRLVGKWRRGRTADCAYLEATQVEAIQKSFW
jgi:hypothetical protein